MFTCWYCGDERPIGEDNGHISMGGSTCNECSKMMKERIWNGNTTKDDCKYGSPYGEVQRRLRTVK